MENQNPGPMATPSVKKTPPHPPGGCPVHQRPRQVENVQVGRGGLHIAAEAKMRPGQAAPRRPRPPGCPEMPRVGGSGQDGRDLPSPEGPLSESHAMVERQAQEPHKIQT